jgi:hypothetical protein
MLEFDPEKRITIDELNNHPAIKNQSLPQPRLETA